MKRTLLCATALAAAISAGSAIAADLPSHKAPVYVPPPPPPLTWNGFYVGLNLGGGWDASGGQQLYSAYYDPRFPFAANAAGPGYAGPNLFFLPNGNSSGSAGGVVGGGQVGYNFQFNPSIVVGVEADFQGTSISGNGPGSYAGYPSFYNPNFVLVPVAAINGGSLGVSWFGTVRGRAGWLVTPTLLIYGTAGFAYGQETAWGFSNTATGWTAGGGVEWMFMPNWSAKAEYLYVDLSDTGVTGSWGWNWGYNFHPQINVLRAGVNYHFNWAAPAPVLAKY